MKAWKVYNCDEWFVLVFAPTRSRAKMIFKEQGPSIYNYFLEWIGIHAVRHPELDGMTDQEALFDSLCDLPDGVTFWPEDEG